jgi:glycosyltransferase involved in cell wall biosynthesis
MTPKLPITVILAARNEEANLPKCLASLLPVERVIVVDSHSIDKTASIAKAHGAEVLQFDYSGGYPKKRQWALQQAEISTPWTFFLDADEVIPETLWTEISTAIFSPDPAHGYMIVKGFHFMGRRLVRGGFSHPAVLLLRTGTGRFEELFDDDPSGLDMEVHERVVVQGRIEALKTPLIHEDFKGLEAYITRHNKYSTWEAHVRYNYLGSGIYGKQTIQSNFFGNSQERRRAIKSLLIRLPFEHWIWFLYHYFVALGCLEGKPGLIASQIRASYIQQVHAKVFELQQKAVAGKDRGLNH